MERRAEDTFLCVGFTCRELRPIPSIDVLDFLKGLPAELEGSYQRVFASLLDPNKPKAADVQRMLTIVATSAHPLTILELADACGFDVDEDIETRMQYMRDRVNHCLLIIDIVPDGDDSQGNTICNRLSQFSMGAQSRDERVVLLHQTVKQFMFTSIPGLFNGGKEQSHAITAYGCLDKVVTCLSESRGFREHGGWLRYAIHYWPYHARLAGASFQVQKAYEPLFLDPSPLRRKWLTWVGGYDPDVVIAGHSTGPALPVLNVAALWGIPSLVDYVSGRASPGLQVDLAQRDHDDIITSVQSPLTDAAVGGSINTFRKLLELGIPLTEETIASAAMQGKGRILRTLLESRGDEIRQRSDLANCAATYLSSSEMAFIVDHPDFTITEPLFYGAMVNEDHGHEVLSMLLSRTPIDAISAKSLLEQTIEDSSVESVRFLTDYFGNRLTIETPMVLRAAENISYGPEIIKLLCERYPDIKLSDDIIIAVLKLHELEASHIHDVLKVLFKLLGPNFRTTKQILLHAAQAEFEFDDEAVVVELVLDHANNSMEITHDIFMAMAQNSNAGESIPLLFNRYGAMIDLRDDILRAAIPHLPAKQLFSVLAAAGILITEEIVAVAAEHWSRIQFAELPQNVDSHIQVTDKILVAATHNANCGHYILLTLFRRQAQNDTVSIKILEGALMSTNEAIMSVILKRRGEAIHLDKELIQGWLRSEQTSGKALKFLLEYKTSEVNSIVDTMSPEEQVEFMEERSKLFKRFDHDSWDDVFWVEGAKG